MKQQPGAKHARKLVSGSEVKYTDASWLNIICLKWNRLKLARETKPKPRSHWNRWFYFARLMELESMSLVFVCLPWLIHYSTGATSQKKKKTISLEIYWMKWDTGEYCVFHSLIWCLSQCHPLRPPQHCVKTCQHIRGDRIRLIKESRTINYNVFVFPGVCQIQEGVVNIRTWM